MTLFFGVGVGFIALLVFLCLGLLLVFGVLLAAVLAKLLLSYEEDPLY